MSERIFYSKVCICERVVAPGLDTDHFNFMVNDLFIRKEGDKYRVLKDRYGLTRAIGDLLTEDELAKFLLTNT